MIEWQQLWVLVFVPIVGAVAFMFYMKRADKHATLQFSSLLYLRGLRRGLRARLAELPLVLKALALILIIFALARPRQATTLENRNVEGVDIVIVLDISDSMLIEDMQPENRLESSKQVIAEFIKKRSSDRIGFVVFSGEAYTRVPLTLDYKLLLDNVKQVKTSRNIKMGTAIGVALATGVNRLKDSAAKSRICIFLTDGENNSGTIDPETALKIAVDNDIKIYSIGMGKDGQAQLPVFVQGPGGQMVKQYRPIHSTINETLLNGFAEKTGGKFWRASTTNALDKVFNEIDSLEKTKFEVNKFTRYTELFQSYVGWAAILYVLSIVLGQTWLRRNP